MRRALRIALLAAAVAASFTGGLVATACRQNGSREVVNPPTSTGQAPSLPGASVTPFLAR